jgi:hypothetical protein
MNANTNTNTNTLSNKEFDEKFPNTDLDFLMKDLKMPSVEEIMGLANRLANKVALTTTTQTPQKIDGFSKPTSEGKTDKNIKMNTNNLTNTEALNLGKTSCLTTIAPRKFQFAVSDLITKVLIHKDYTDMCWERHPNIKKALNEWADVDEAEGCVLNNSSILTILSFSLNTLMYIVFYGDYERRMVRNGSTSDGIHQMAEQLKIQLEFLGYSSYQVQSDNLDVIDREWFERRNRAKAFVAFELSVEGTANTGYTLDYCYKHQSITNPELNNTAPAPSASSILRKKDKDYLDGFKLKAGINFFPEEETPEEKAVRLQAEVEVLTMKPEKKVKELSPKELRKQEEKRQIAEANAYLKAEKKRKEDYLKATGQFKTPEQIKKERETRFKDQCNAMKGSKR